MEPESPIRAATDSERIARLERSLRWLKVTLVVFLICVVIPPVGGVLGLLLFIVGIAAAVVGFIVVVMCLLERWFPGKRPQS